MSENNRDGQRTARERLREQRARDKAREKRRRTAIVAGGVVAVLAIAAGVAIGLANTGGGSGTATAPPGATGSGDLALPAGRPDAPATLTVYEDFRCPACDAFERVYRDTLHDLENSGQLKVHYHLVTLIDGNTGGSGSLNAANAAACAQRAGKFLAYHDVLYDNQPDERDDRFADTGYLDQLAGKVSGLKTAAFTSCTADGPYKPWVRKSNSAFNKSNYSSTPTVLLGGRSIYGDQANPLTPDRLRAMVAEADRGKTPGSAAPGPAGSASRAASGTASATASAGPAAGRPAARSGPGGRPAPSSAARSPRAAAPVGSGAAYGGKGAWPGQSARSARNGG